MLFCEHCAIFYEYKMPFSKNRGTLTECKMSFSEHCIILTECRT